MIALTLVDHLPFFSEPCVAVTEAPGTLSKGGGVQPLFHDLSCLFLCPCGLLPAHSHVTRNPLTQQSGCFIIRWVEQSI